MVIGGGFQAIGSFFQGVESIRAPVFVNPLQSLELVIQQGVASRYEAFILGACVERIGRVALVPFRVRLRV